MDLIQEKLRELEIGNLSIGSRHVRDIFLGYVRNISKSFINNGEVTHIQSQSVSSVVEKNDYHEEIPGYLLGVEHIRYAQIEFVDLTGKIFQNLYGKAEEIKKFSLNEIRKIELFPGQSKKLKEDALNSFFESLETCVDQDFYKL